LTWYTYTPTAALTWHIRQYTGTIRCLNNESLLGIHAHRSVGLTQLVMYRDDRLNHKNWLGIHKNLSNHMAHSAIPKCTRVITLTTRVDFACTLNEALTWYTLRYTGIIATINRVHLVYTPIAAFTWHMSCYTGTITSITTADVQYRDNHLSQSQGWLDTCRAIQRQSPHTTVDFL
jgi:hypothetical protein